MKQGKIVWFFFVVAALGAFVLVNGTSAVAKTIELSYSNFFPPSHIQAKLGESWAKEIEKRTNGKVKITYYPGGSLLKGPKIYDGIVSGITDIGMSVLAYSRGRFPAMAAFDLPLGYPNGKCATTVINTFYDKFRPKELSDVKVLYLFGHGPGLLHSKKPVYKLEDIKGLKIRATGNSAKVAQALGAVPVAMGQGGAYEALQKGVVDGTFAPMETLKGWKQAEVIKDTTECFSIAYSTGFFVAMNLKKWDALPKSVQEVFMKVSREWIPKTGAAWDTSDAEGRKFTLSLGNKIIPLSPAESARWEKAVQPVLSGYVKKADAEGLPGQEYVDFLKKAIHDCR